MQRFLLTITAALTLGSVNAQVEALMPIPAEVNYGTERFNIDGFICTSFGGVRGDRLEAGVGRFMDRLSRITGMTLSGDGECLKYLHINVSTTVDLSAEMDESYELRITEDSIVIRSNTDVGALRSLSTVYQMVNRDGIQFHIKECVVRDSPRFPWRGLLVDVCRHFMPREVVLRQLDGMELVKLNVLHLHLTEDQGFRIESKKFPDLHGKGSNGEYLTQSDIHKIVHEADLRGIRVIPELDMPGHSTSWFVGYPELASAPGPYSVETGFGVFDPTIDPTKETTYSFLDQLIGEMAELFPDPYFHIGGDENNGKQWGSNPSIQLFMKTNGLDDNHALQAYFNKRLSTILAGHGKQMIGWDEILSDDLPDGTMIQSWRGKEGLITAAKSGRKAILSNGWYIDLCKETSHHYLNDPVTDDMGLSEEEQAYVLGGEATMWSELVDRHNVDTRIWPRTAAIAERLWSPAHIRDVDDMYDRLDKVSFQLDAIGPEHISAQENLLRIMAGGSQVSALKQRVDVVAPVKGYRRHSLAPHNTNTPLTNLADAAVPDPVYVREVDRMISNHFAQRTKLTEDRLLAELRRLRKTLRTDKRTAHLPEIPYIFELLDYATDAVHVINGSSKWESGTIAEIQELTLIAREPFAECELALLIPLDRLYQAAIAKSE